MLVIDDVVVDMSPEQRAQAHPDYVQANETFVEVAKHVRGAVGDDHLSYLAWTTHVSGLWCFGLFELLYYCNAAGAVVPDELLDRCLESETHYGLITPEVDKLRERNRNCAAEVS